MSNTKHTPGPWVAHQGWANSMMDNAATMIEHPNWCEVTGGSFDTGDHISINGHFGIANARLIATAPELLEALEGLISVVGLTAFKYEAQRAVLQDAIDIAQSAIAKATQP